MSYVFDKLRRVLHVRYDFVCVGLPHLSKLITSIERCTVCMECSDSDNFTAWIKSNLLELHYKIHKGEQLRLCFYQPRLPFCKLRLCFDYLVIVSLPFYAD